MPASLVTVDEPARIKHHAAWAHHRGNLCNCRAHDGRFLAYFDFPDRKDVSWRSAARSTPLDPTMSSGSERKQIYALTGSRRVDEPSLAVGSPSTSTRVSAAAGVIKFLRRQG